jgi:hypothetical protein
LARIRPLLWGIDVDNNSGDLDARNRVVVALRHNRSH